MSSQWRCRQGAKTTARQPGPLLGRAAWLRMEAARRGDVRVIRGRVLNPGEDLNLCAVRQCWTRATADQSSDRELCTYSALQLHCYFSRSCLLQISQLQDPDGDVSSVTSSGKELQLDLFLKLFWPKTICMQTS